MPGLLDIHASSKSVKIGEIDVDVFGVSADGVAKLLGRFVELRKLFSGLEVGLDADTLICMGGEIVNAIIAAGCGYPGNLDAEAAAGRLAVDAQVDLLTEILKLTMPGGVGPFVDKLTALGGALTVKEVPATLGELAMKSRKRSSS